MKQVHRNHFSEGTLVGRSDKFFLDLAREFKAKNGRPPRSTELGFSNRRIIYRRWKTWDTFIQKALAMPHSFKHWSEEDVLKFLRDDYEKRGRFPTSAELDEQSESLKSLIYQRYGNLHSALEAAIGSSPRKEITFSLQRLNVNGCDKATTGEIFEDIRSRKIEISRQVVANTLEWMSRQGLLLRGVYGTAAWWKLPKGGAS